MDISNSGPGRGMSLLARLLAVAGGAVAGLLLGAAVIDEPISLVVIAGLPVVALGVYVFWRALTGDRAMIMLVFVIGVFLLDAVFRTRSYSEKSVDFQVIIKLASWAALLALAAVNFGGMLKHVFSGARLPWTAFFAWLLMSTLLSPNVGYSIVIAMSLISFYLFLAAIITRFTTEQILVGVLVACILMAIASLVVYVAVPGLGRTKVWQGGVQVISGRLAGLAGNANAIGRICCLGILICVLIWPHLRRMARFLPHACLGLLVLTLLLSNSRTSMFVTGLVIAIHLFARGRNFHLMIMGLCGLLLLLMAAIPFSEAIMIAMSRSGRAEEIATGTNRTLIWHVVGLLGWQKPLTGWGYGSTIFVMPLYERFMGHAAPHAHNIILQLWVSTGMIGVALFVTAFMSRLVAALAQNDRVVVSLLLFVAFNGLTESSAFAGMANIASVALVLAAVTQTRVVAVPAALKPAKRQDRVRPASSR